MVPDIPNLALNSDLNNDGVLFESKGLRIPSS